MNMKLEKKIYEAPQMSVFDMRGQASLLADSTGGPPDLGEENDYDGELGFRSLSDINRKV